MTEYQIVFPNDSFAADLRYWTKLEADPHTIARRLSYAVHNAWFKTAYVLKFEHGMKVDKIDAEHFMFMYKF
jgi:hypothetical protein